MLTEEFLPIARLDTSSCPTPAWLPDGHSQTLYAATLAAYHRLAFVRERVETPDGDFLDFDWRGPGRLAHDTSDQTAAIPPSASKTAAVRWITETDWSHMPRSPDTPALILFHGLEGSSQSHYAQAIAHYFHTRRWVVIIAHFRGCSGTPNRLARAYYSGDSAEIGFMLHHVRARLPQVRWHAIGVSLGGNALLKHLGEQKQALSWLTACAGISVPVELAASGHHLGQHFLNRHLYTPHFLRTMKKKVLAKAQQFPELIDVKRIARARNLQDFDDAYTAPLHGFHNALDYWTQASSKPWLSEITVPTLILHARNDPFLPPSALPQPADCASCVLLHQPAQGGHVGFPSGPFPGHLNWLPQRLERFFAAGT